MKLADSHCHLNDPAYAPDLDEVLQRAARAGVTAMMVIGTDPASSARAVQLASEHPACYASVGIHPHEAKLCRSKDLEGLYRLAGRPPVRAWGEIGLDFNRLHSPRQDQEKWLVKQLAAAESLDLPLILHERDSGGRLLEMLLAWGDGRHRGVVHCFTGNRTELSRYLDMGLHIGITGILTIKGRGAALREMVGCVPADRLLIETDAPYLTPTPERNRHRRNEPAFVRTVLAKLAQVRGQDADKLAEIIWHNTCRLFRIED